MCALATAAAFSSGSRACPRTAAVVENECNVLPGDPSIAQAQSGVSITNTRLGIAIGGAAMLVGDLVWYVLQPAAPSRSAKTGIPHVFTS